MLLPHALRGDVLPRQLQQLPGVWAARDLAELHVAGDAHHGGRLQLYCKLNYAPEVGRWGRMMRSLYCVC
jgi:hypothetical protein